MSKKISELPVAGSIATTDIFAAVVGGTTTERATIAQIGEANVPGLNPAFLAANPLNAIIVNGAGTAVSSSLVVDLPLPVTDLDPSGGNDGDVVTRVTGVPAWANTSQGADTQVAFKDGTILSGTSDFIFDKNTGRATIFALTVSDSCNLTSPTITGTVVYQGTRLRILSIPGEVQTTDDTVTTIVSFTMVDETMCAFDVIVTAALQTAPTDGGRWKRSVVYYRTAAGVPLIVGTLESGTDQEISAGLDVTIDDDGVDTVRVRVTGLPATTNINWTAELRVQETLSTP